MNCLHCKGELKKGTTTYTVSRSGYHLTIDNLAAYICSQCGEALLDESAVATIEQIVSELDKRTKKLHQIAA